MIGVVDAISNSLKQHEVENCKVCVALSGGLDSIVLLNALCELAAPRNIVLSAFHVDHGLSPHAQKWTAFCIEQCRQLGVALTVERVTVDAGAGLGTEAAARAARYAVFAKCDAEYLALAHHADDQVETFLIQLLRGSGAPGLSSMPLERVLGSGAPRLLRPMLSRTRAELEAFASQRALRWIEDESNTDLAFDRNFLRHSLLPVLEQRFPAYRSTLSRATQNLADAAKLLDVLGRQDLLSLRAGNCDQAGDFDHGGNSDHGDVGRSGLRVDVLKSWPRARALNTLRYLFREESLTLPHRAAISEALRQVVNARPDAQIRVDFGEVSLRRYRDHVYLVRNIEVPPDWHAKWSGKEKVALPKGLGELHLRPGQGAGLSARALDGADISVGFRRGGERMAVAAGRPHRNLGKLFQDAGVAPWLRERTPIVFCGEKVAWVPGLGCAAEFQASLTETSFKVEWLHVVGKAQS